jgi:HSP20 family protein
MTQHASDIFSEFSRINERMAQAWRVVIGPPGGPHFCLPVIEPAADVYETNDDVVVVVELAGIADQEVEIIINGRDFTVRGERAALQGQPGRLYAQMEICFGPFERSLLLPTEVDPDGAKASYHDGFLQITFPKVKRQVSRQVRIVAR